MRKTVSLLCVLVAAGFAYCAPLHDRTGDALESVDISHGITLHYTEKGKGDPVIFVHGSLSDYSYWNDQLNEFSKNYRAIAYSRRYNFPNKNPSRSGYSAITDSDDLASFIKARSLGKVFVVGHSYGALTGLFLAVRHPELVKALVIAEPPAMSLLNDLANGHAKAGRQMFANIQAHMVEPMKTAFAEGDTEGGVSIFIDYVFDDPRAWQKMSSTNRHETLRDAREWEVMLPKGTLFPTITESQVREIRLPVLIMSGAKSYPFLRLIDEDLATLLPNNEQVEYPNAGHQMWYQEPVQCRLRVEEFFRKHAD